MQYISRRINVTEQNGEEVEYSDNEFFNIDLPLVLLGEPGAGKSELLRFASQKLGATVYDASALNSMSQLNVISDVIIVDGIDEIAAYENGTPISKVLSKISPTKKIIFSCRAADWQDAINTRIIHQIWSHPPIVGQILPLSEREIIDFVNGNGEGQDGEEFLIEAKKREIADLAKNPQNLLLLLKSIKNKGWPDTKLELYENACSELVKEFNKSHLSINKQRPHPDKIINAAGYIFSLLILSGKAAIQFDGNSDEGNPTIQDLECEFIDNNAIQSALSTMLFRPVGANMLEPCHRTVAEFLAAKWIGKCLRNKLSIRRLEGMLYGSGYIVPSALRGLHAWIATLNPLMTDLFIKRDPYGFFRYGDSSILQVSLAKSLLDELEKAADVDPYFRSKDWHISFSKGLAREELRENILHIIKNPKSPTQLSHLLIESMQGTPFADSLSEELIDLILNQEATSLERQSAVDALSESASQPDWDFIVNKLRKLGDAESLRIALGIVKEHIRKFSGVVLAEIINELTCAKEESGEAHIVGVGYGLQNKLSIIQLEESLDSLAGFMDDNKESNGRRRYAGVEEFFYDFIQERFRRGDLPPAEKMWSWFKPLERHSYHRSDWDKYSAEYSSQNIQYRHAIQIQAINSSKTADELWLTLFHIGDASPGLWIREDDLVLHLNRIVDKKDQYLDWDIRWKRLVQWGRIHRDFSGSFLNIARSQARKSKQLAAHMKDLEKPPERDYEKEENERERKYRRERQRNKQARHNSYEKIQNELGAGKHLGALGSVAKAYLEFKEASSPTDRVTELVGSTITSIAFEGLKAVMFRDDIPTARQIVTLHAKESKEYHFEAILLAHCAMTLQSKGDLNSLPIEIARSALAACHWDLHFGDDFTSDLQQQLEAIVFSDTTNKETFIRDTIEPYLDTGAEHISGLYRVTHNEQFSDMAGRLAIEWIKNHRNLSGRTLRELLIAAINYVSQNEVVELIRSYVSDEEQRSIWIGASFLLDFENSKNLLSDYAKEKKENLWSLRSMSFPERENFQYWPELCASQHFFYIDKFGYQWPPENHPSDGWSGDQNPWDAYEFIRKRISDLADNLSDEAEAMLSSLINKKGLEGYQGHIKHLYTQQARRRSEANKVALKIEGVKNILLKGEPSNHEDLQAILVDELDGLQERVRNGNTNDILPFWNGDIPHEENYCRDRIASAISPYLERYNIRTHPEGTMPDNNRCDLLNTYEAMNLPIEIKGQWHSEVWNAAGEQLQNYTREYRSDGRGIYLVLWFGYLGSNNKKNPHGWKGQSLPNTLAKMKELLESKCQGVSEKTKIIVLDLSKPRK